MTMRRDVHDDLRARLREATEGHEPDRARILARVERGMMAAGSEPQRHRQTRPVLGWARIVGATAAVAGMLAVGGYAVASVVKDEPPAERTVAVSPSPERSPDATSRPPNSPSPTHGSGSDAGSSTPPSANPTHTAGSSPSPTDGGAGSADGQTDGPLSSDGTIDAHSNQYWTQSDVTLKTSKQLTALTVQLKIAQTGGVSNTGAWRALPEDDFTFTVGEQGGFLVYTWVLKDGRTVNPGQWVFAGQYDLGRGGRGAGGDSYAISGTAAGKTHSVSGGFAAAGASQ